MNEQLFTGSGVAMVTPFCADGVDFPALGSMIDRQLAGGTDALIVCGTTGEPPTLSEEEKERVIAFAVERTNGRVPVIAGTGSNNTAYTMRQATRARVLGANGLLVVTPYYNRPSQRGLIDHYRAVADAGRLPLILYNVPSRTGVNLLPETAAKLAAHPLIAGIKEASGNLPQIMELFSLLHEHLAIYCGNDDQILPFLALGGQGAVSVAANVVPGLTHELVASWLRGDTMRSRSIQLALLPLCRALFAEVNPVPVKAALSLLGLCEETVRPPLVPLTPEHRAQLTDVMKDLPEFY